jgi:ABC-type nitrate/sulfonate/bicarbonate transport system ATPase subunit
MEESIILKDISYSFAEKVVLENLNISIKNGSFHSLVGISGAGKTLTLKLIASLIPGQMGSISGRPEKITYAFQSSPLIPWLTVKENLKICTKDITELDSFLVRLKLEAFSNLFPNELSGGMIQKINILRSFLGRPDLILMDEPFVHIDLIQKEELHRFLINLWEASHPTIIFVTHDIDEALYLSQEISLYSSRNKKVTQTIKLSPFPKTNLLEFKNSLNYQEDYKFIYHHLKQDQPL